MDEETLQLRLDGPRTPEDEAAAEVSEEVDESKWAVYEERWNTELHIDAKRALARPGRTPKQKSQVERLRNLIALSTTAKETCSKIW